MKMFGSLSTEGTEKVVDRVGGSGGAVDTDIYIGVIKAVYIGKSTSSASQSFNILATINGREYRENLWVTNKSGQNTYEDKKDATKRHLLPGYITADDLCLLATNLPLNEQIAEEKVLNLYDFDSQREIPTSVMVLTGLTGKPICIAVERQTVDKTAKDTNGIYHPTGETRDQNEIIKVLYPEDMRSVTEIREEIKEAVFAPKWLEKYKGKTNVKAKGTQGKTGAPGAARPGAAAGSAPGAAAAPKTSLFGPK